MLAQHPPCKAMIMTRFSMSMFVQFIIIFTLLMLTIVIVICTQTCTITSSTTTAMMTLSCWPSEHENENNHRMHTSNNALDIQLGCHHHNHCNHVLETMKGRFGQTVRKKGSKQNQVSSSSDSHDTRMERCLLMEEQDLLCQSRMEKHEEQFERNQERLDQKSSRKESLWSASSLCSSMKNESSTVVLPLSMSTLKSSNCSQSNSVPMSVDCQSSTDKRTSSLSDSLRAYKDKKMHELQRKTCSSFYKNKKCKKECFEMKRQAASYKK